MELWIRSQDKERLKKVDNVFIEEYVCGGANVETNNCVLGSYKTRERALEILNEIQELLICNGYAKEKISAMVSGVKNEYIVYEMPKE